APPKNKQALQPFLILQTEPIKGAVETRVEHDLHLFDREADPPPHWQLKTTIKVKPILTGVDHFEISLQPGYELDKSSGNDSPDVVEEIMVDSQKRSAQLRLATKRLDEFSVRLYGTYPFLVDRQETSLELPRPLTWSVDRIVSGDRTPLMAASA